MRWVRFAVDLGEDEIGPFAYSRERYEFPRLPTNGEPVSLDADRRHSMSVVETTPGFSDDVDTWMVWGRPTVEKPISQDELWDLDYHAGAFQSFDIDGKRFSAHEIVARADRRAELRRAHRVALTIAMGTGAALTAVAGVADAHVIVM